MKKIKYKVLSYLNTVDENGESIMVETLADAITDYSESALEVVKETAYDGEYTIEDDGQTETPSQLDTIEAQVTYTAMMTDTLLEV